MYRYYSIHTDSYLNTWRTEDVEKYIDSKMLFASAGNGAYKSIDTHFELQLLLVNDWESWSSNDYNRMNTNYISIVTDELISNECEGFIQELSAYLGGYVNEEEC